MKKISLILIFLQITIFVFESKSQDSGTAFLNLKRINSPDTTSVDTCRFDRSQVIGIIALKSLHILGAEYDFREYLQFKIQGGVQKGKTYRIELHFGNLSPYTIRNENNISDNKCKRKIGQFGISGLGFNFRQKPYPSKLDDKIHIIESEVDPVEIELPFYYSNRLLTFTEEYTPDNNYSYLVFGNFKPVDFFKNADNFKLLNGEAPDDVARYFVESIKIQALDSILIDSALIENPIDTAYIDTSPDPPIITGNFDKDSIELGKKYIVEALQFEEGEDYLSENAKSILNLLGKYLKENRRLKVKLEGHTSSGGKPEENMKLSERRVTNCFEYLVSKSRIRKKRIEVEWFGETKPLPNTTEANKHKNRRVEIIFFKD